jgi:ATP-dependent DNA ligase
VTSTKGLSRLQVPPSIEPMEAKLVDELPAEPGWQFEPKWDGFRCLAFRSSSEVALHAKSGKPLGRYFPDVVALLQSLPEKRFVLDGELLIQENRTFSFDALQMRLHPAESRVRKLSEAMPATYVLFDMLLSPEGESLLQKPFTLRLAALEQFFAIAGALEWLQLSPYTRDRREAVKWLEQAGHVLDGVMAKQLDGTYQPGVRAMLKVKLQRTADCVVGGFRYGTRSKEVGSLLLGLYDAEGKLDHVGFTSTIPHADRPALTKKLEALRAPPGFTGRAPGGPSRWSTERSAAWVPVRPKLVVEVRYDQVTGDRFRHGTMLLRFRPDKAPRQCTFEQLKPPARPPKVVTKLLRPGPHRRCT